MGLSVSVGIDGDENDLDAIAIGSQSFQIGGQLHQGARADVRAESEAEEKSRRQAGDVAFGERGTVLGQQIESDTRAGRGRGGRYRDKEHNHDEPASAFDSTPQEHRKTVLRATMGSPIKPKGGACGRKRTQTHGNCNLTREPGAGQGGHLHIVPILDRCHRGRDPANFRELGDICLVAIDVTGETG